ncbi:MAG: acyl-CoA dehydrogenase family protein [Candidatus Firestonebacteria bacterium]|nr:acyl-CoA dehydrogenase family protein [Candidatus Firestonebacteria bacterium]
MSYNTNFDVVVIGAGPAGITAAVGVAKQGLKVAVIEGAVFPGAENWSGCVYFTENLASPKIFGEEIINNAPYERVVAKRGMFITDGITSAGIEYNSQKTFKNSYIVLRPIYDRYLANAAKKFGVEIFNETHVSGLLRRNKRIIGVNTERGPIYANIVFLAEGDASELVAKEGYEKHLNPSFMQGIKLVFELHKTELEKRFSLNDKEGAAYEILLRNANIGGHTVPLNIAGFLYTNRNSVSLGIIISLDNLKQYFNGEHNILIEWYRSLPFIQHFIEGANLTSYGAKLIRSGGFKQSPKLVDNGLAIGGAATGLGIDLPYPNFTGPATCTGFMFSQAVDKIIKKNSDFTEKELNEEYLIPLFNTHYALNAKSLEDWPEYLEKTRTLFETYIDIPLGWIAISYSPELNVFTRLSGHARLLRDLLSSKKINILKKDINNLKFSLNFKNSKNNPFRQFLPIDSILDIFSFLFSSENSDLRIKIFIQNKEVGLNKLPFYIKFKLKVLNSKIAKVISLFYENNSITWTKKISYAAQAFSNRITLIDVLEGLFYIVLSGLTAIYDAFRFFVLKVSADKILNNFVEHYKDAVRKAGNLDDRAIHITDTIEKKLSTITYLPSQNSHIIFNWPKKLNDNKDIESSSLWHVCPAHVYSFKNAFSGYPKIIIDYENCIKCETCWHSVNNINWTRSGTHRLIYEVYSSVIDTDVKESYNKKQLDNYEICLSNSIMNNYIHNFKLAYIYFSRTLDNTHTHLIDNTRREWLNKLFVYIEEVVDEANEFVLNKCVDDKNSINLCKEWKQKIIDLKPHLEKNNFLWIKDQLSNIWLDILHQHQIIESDNTKIENYDKTMLDKKLHNVFNMQSIQNFEHTQELSRIELDLFKSIIISCKNSMISLISKYDPTLAYIFALNICARRIINYYDQFDEKNKCNVSPDDIIIPIQCNNIEIKILSGKIIINGKTGLFPSSISDKLLLTLPEHILIADKNEFPMEYVKTIGFRGCKFAQINFENYQVSLSKLNKLSLLSIKEINRLTEPDGINIIKIVEGVGEYLLERCYEHAQTRVQFAGEMRDSQGEEGIIKFGAVKKYLSEIEINLYILKSLEENKGSCSWEDKLFKITALSAFGPGEGSFGYNAGQIFGGIGYSEDDLLGKYYRDSSFFRQLIGPEYKLLRELGTEIFKNRDYFTKELHADKNKIQNNIIFNDYIRKYEDEVNTFNLQFSAIIHGDIKDDVNFLIMLGKVFIELYIAKSVLQSVCNDFCFETFTEKKLKILEHLVSVLPISISAIKNDFNQTAKTSEIGSKFLNNNNFNLELTEEKKYSELIKHGLKYNSGQVFTNPIDITRPVFCKDFLFNDKDLAAHWESISQTINEIVSRPLPDNLNYERYLEKIHGIPEEDIKTMKEKGFFSTIIPIEYGGKGWKKIHYYILCWIASGSGDPALAITIMANTSIGTTPVTIGQKEDLEKLKEELNQVISNINYFGDIETNLKKLLQLLAHPDPSKIKYKFEESWKLIEERISHTQALKYLGKNFIMSFYFAGQAGKNRDLNTVEKHLKDAILKLSHMQEEIKKIQTEIPRRIKAYELFYRLLSDGQISAFGLTEPTAGSDSGGVKTTGKLKSKKLYPDKNNRWYFYLDEENKKDIRYLIETERVYWRNGRITYKYNNSLPSTPIFFDEYDYKTDDPNKLRYFLVNDEKIYFHDIAQVRGSENEIFYEYYETSGTKMWITNAKIAGQFALFAKIEEGITGFIVDRHAEGLIVGKDEKKMGQLGSCTNEIALNKVRIPRENIIGTSGHGQVIALETLNSGRTGLAVSATAIMNKIAAMSKDKITKIGLQNPNNAILSSANYTLSELGKIFIQKLISESLSFELIALWDSHTTNSVRLESAVAKFFCSELLHKILYSAEDFFSIEGQTERSLIEKIRRDARILNIYEGTNEVQRFLVLKDLVRISHGKYNLEDTKMEFQSDVIKNAANKLMDVKKRLQKYL